MFIRRLSNKALAVLVVLLGMALASFAVFNVSGYGNMGVGWTLDGVNFLGGTLRMLFPFSLGMLMSRNFKPMKVNGAFWICTIILIALFSVPYLEGLEPICMNGIYEAFCVIAVFPFLVWLVASGTTTDKQSTKICKFLGDISYPVYVVHYPHPRCIQCSGNIGSRRCFAKGTASTYRLYREFQQSSYRKSHCQICRRTKYIP